jgi:hypothetical protein
VVLKEHFVGSDHDYLLRIGTKASALRFWKANLPKHGWVVTGETRLAGVVFSLHFHGHGFGGSKTVINFISKNRAAVLLHRTA